MDLVFCPKCGRAFPDDYYTCPGCGHSFESKTKRFLRIIFWVLLILAGIGLLIQTVSA